MITILDILIKTSRATTFAYGNLVQAKRIFDSMLSKVIFAFAGFFDKEDSG
jgi:ATP-binding cassette subfamily C (CFTR/MRP) protein 10